MRKKIVAGNWKMNLSKKEAIQLFDEVINASSFNELEVYIFPSALYLNTFPKSNSVKIGAQNAYPKDNGAFTGEVSMKQLAESEINAVLIGHSERREYFSESNAFLKEKVDAALANGITPFFCCGESLTIRESNNFTNFLKQQLEESLFHLTEREILKCVIAYEPIWAIGTGVTATKEQAEEAHAFIRKCLSERYSEEIAQKISLLYGGSCNPSNSKDLFACPNVDGGLIGGAALKISDFSILISEQTWTI